MVERITSRRSMLRTLPALREEALPRPRAQRMCRGVHTESSADRSEMGQIDRSRRRRGCAGALRHKICTASLDNRPLIDGFARGRRSRSHRTLSLCNQEVSHGFPLASIGVFFTSDRLEQRLAMPMWVDPATLYPSILRQSQAPSYSAAPSRHPDFTLGPPASCERLWNLLSS